MKKKFSKEIKKFSKSINGLFGFKMNKKFLIVSFSIFIFGILFISIIVSAQQQNPPPPKPPPQEQQKNALFFPQLLTPFAIITLVALILFYFYAIRNK